MHAAAFLKMILSSSNNKASEKKKIRNKAIFLDRDGVINEDFGHVGHISNFKILDGVFEALVILINLGFKLVIVTNQAGIAKGYYTEEDYSNLTNYMIELFKDNNINIDLVVHCPHHHDFTGKCNCRKPSPGMILYSSKKLNVDLENSFMVGDNLTDVEAGLSAGIENSYLIQEKKEYKNKTYNNIKRFSSLLEFANYLKRGK